MKLSKWKQFKAAVAFLKLSGMEYISGSLKSFSENNHTSITVGVAHQGTSKEGLELLLASLGKEGEAFVFHNNVPSTFHPKVFAFANPAEMKIFLGSGNLTKGGLYTNYEAFFEATEATSSPLSLSVENAFSQWTDETTSLVRPLSAELISQLVAEGLILGERELQARLQASSSTAETTGKQKGERLFGSKAVKQAPPRTQSVKKVPRDLDKTRTRTVEDLTPKIPPDGSHLGFVMLLQKTDVGTGQTTSGSSRRSPEIFIPLAARNYDSVFWGWPNLFTPDAAKAGKMDRYGVRMRLGTSIILVNMMTWPDKSDFRLRSEALRSAGNVGDVLRIERISDAIGHSYYAEIVPAGTSDYPRYRGLCIHPVRNSQKRWGYY